MSLEVGVESTPECFGSPSWRALLDAGADRHVFATPEWSRLWWEEFGDSGARKDLYVLHVRRAGEVVGLVPLYRKHEEGRKVLRFVGGIDLTDYLGPICAPGDRDEVAAALTGWLAAAEIEWDEFDAHNMPVPFGFADHLVDQADRRSMPFSLDQEETAAILMLPDSWETYEASLPSKDRHELRRKRRRMGRECPDATIRTATSETLEADLQTFIDMHRGAQGHKGHFMKPEIATFFVRIARAFDALGWLRLDLLEVAGSPIASTFGFELDGIFYLYNSAYEPEAARLSPGLMLVAGLVERSIETGCTRFDFLRGPERYKYQLGAQAVPLHNVRILPPR